eukprot:940752_1
MFLMSFGLYFVCSCCRRSRVRIGLGRERVINAVDNANANANANVNANANANANDRPRRGAVDANINNLQPLINQNNDNRPPLVLNDLAPPNQNDNNNNNDEMKNNNDDDDDDDDDDENNDMNPSERAIKAALNRYLNKSNDNDNDNDNESVMMNGPIEMKKK